MAKPYNDSDGAQPQYNGQRYRKKNHIPCNIVKMPEWLTAPDPARHRSVGGEMP